MKWHTYLEWIKWLFGEKTEIPPFKDKPISPEEVETEEEDFEDEEEED